jgi:hypothetical protein
VSARSLNLTVLKGAFALCRLSPGEPLPDWATQGEFYSITRTASELSVIVLEAVVPAGVRAQGGFCCIGVEGPFELSTVGVVASLTEALARGGISLFVLSTFDTDYLLLNSADLDEAARLLSCAGHRVER